MAWQDDVLERGALLSGAALGEGAFAPGPALWVGTREVAHVHGDDTLEVRLTRPVIRDRRAELRSDERISLRAGSSDWIDVRVREPADVDLASALIRDAVAANLPTAPPGLPPSGADLARRRRFH